MWVTFVFIIVILLLVSRKRLRRWYLDKFVRSTQQEHLNKLYNKFKHRFTSSQGGRNLSSVDQVYCICSKKQETYIKNHLGRYGLNVTYLDAIFPVDLTDVDYDTLSYTNYIYCTKMYKKKTRLPVQLSFVMCLIDALKKGYKTITIFEDDIVIDVDPQILDDSLDEFRKSDYDIFYMGYCYLWCNQKFDTKKHEYIVEVPNRRALCTHAVTLKTSYLAEMIEYMFPMSVQSDQAMRSYFGETKRGVCVPKFNYVYQDIINHGTQNENKTDMHKTCDIT